jgi:hypothetical protein
MAQIDQHDDETDGFGTVPSTLHSLLFFSPAGQEFTPTFTSLNFVELRTRSFWNSFDGPDPGGSLQVDIRAWDAQDPAAGQLLGTSSTVTLPPGFGQSETLGGLTHFDFSSISLTPGTPYALQVVLLTPGNWAVLDNAGSPPFYGGVTAYAGGSGFVLDNPNFATDFALYFREGITVSEPSTMSLLALSGLGLILIRRRRK